MPAAERPTLLADMLPFSPAPHCLQYCVDVRDDGTADVARSPTHEPLMLVPSKWLKPADFFQPLPARPVLWQRGLAVTLGTIGGAVLLGLAALYALHCWQAGEWLGLRGVRSAAGAYCHRFSLSFKRMKSGASASAVQPSRSALAHSDSSTSSKLADSSSQDSWAVEADVEAGLGPGPQAFTISPFAAADVDNCGSPKTPRSRVRWAIGADCAEDCSAPSPFAADAAISSLARARSLGRTRSNCSTPRSVRFACDDDDAVTAVNDSAMGLESSCSCGTPSCSGTCATTTHTASDAERKLEALLRLKTVRSIGERQQAG